MTLEFFHVEEANKPTSWCLWLWQVCLVDKDSECGHAAPWYRCSLNWQRHYRHLIARYKLSPTSRFCLKETFGHLGLSTTVLKTRWFRCGQELTHLKANPRAIHTGNKGRPQESEEYEVVSKKKEFGSRQRPLDKTPHIDVPVSWWLAAAVQDFRLPILQIIW